MHIKALRVFCDVVEQRSFSEAAASNGVSQSAASQMMNHVEGELGVKLIDRSQRPIALLPAGEMFYRGCRKIVDQYAELEHQLVDFVAAESGQVNVASIYSVGLSHMNRFVQQFMSDSPQSNVRVEYQHPDRVYEMVEMGQVHFGLVSYPRDSRSVTATRWREERIVVACAPSHPFALRKVVSLAELHGQDLVGYDERLQIWAAIDQALSEAGAEVNVVMRFDNTETIKRALEIGVGVGLLPSPTLTHEVKTGSLVRIPLAGAGLIRPVGIIQRRGRDLPSEAERFVQFLLKNSFVDDGTTGEGMATAAPSEQLTSAT